MSMTHVEHRYVEAVMRMYGATPTKVTAAYKECWPHHFDASSIEDEPSEGVRVRACAGLDANDGFDRAACFQEVWDDAWQALQAQGVVGEQP